MQRLETTARFICPVCGKIAITQVAVPEPNWLASEKISEMTSEDQTDLRSVTPMIDATEVILIKRMYWLNTGGMTFLTACGATINLKTCQRFKPVARPAWMRLGRTERSAARKSSAR